MSKIEHAMKNRKRMPVIGEAFDADQMNAVERVESYVSELEYYRPRGFSKLVREGRTLARDMWRAVESDCAYVLDHANEWKSEVEALLTEWARRMVRHDYISFGSFEISGSVGFSVDVDSARDDADLVIEAGESVPRGFSGMAFFVNDHGNCHAHAYSRGRKCRELFDVV